MPFKQLKIYRLQQPIDLSAEKLHELLQTQVFHPCGALEPSRIGWISPLPRQVKSEQLAYQQDDFVLFCAQEQQKLLPPSIVNELLQERVDEIEQHQVKAVGRKQKKELKEALIEELLPRAFAKNTRYYGYFDQKRQLLILDVASQNKAEQITELLRQSLGSLPIVPLHKGQQFNHVLTGWLRDQKLPEALLSGQKCEMFDPDEGGGIIRCSKQELNSPQIRAHLENGKLVSKLELIWDGKLEFVLQDNLMIKSLKYTDILKDQTESHEDIMAQFDIDFQLMTQSYAQLLDYLLALFMQQPESTGNTRQTE